MKPRPLELILSHFKGDPLGPIPTPDDWEKCEQELGREVPNDYKTIINTSGAPSLGRCWLRNPAVTSHLALSRTALIREELIFGPMAKEMLDIDLYPELGGWIELAFMDRVLFMLKPTGDDIVIADLSGWEIYETGMTFSALMWSLFEGRNLYDELGESIWRKSKSLFGF
jgi:hypothetical protein